MLVIYPWCSRVIRWVSTQPCVIDSLDILQSSSSWDCLSLSLINHFLCLILGVQLLYSFIRYWLAQFQCAAIVSHCFFLFHCPILGSVLNLALSMAIAFWFWSHESLDALICIHHLLQNYAVLLIIRFSVDISLWKPLCFLAYAFLMLSLFYAWFKFVFSVRMSPHWLIPVCQLFSWLPMSFPHLPIPLDHFCDLEVALLPPLIVVLLQYAYLTLLSLHVSPLTGVTGLALMCLVEFIPPSFLLLQLQ